jgi:hypothetical protein
MLKTQKMMIAALMGAVLAVSACSTEQVVDNTVGATGFVAKTAVKGTIGAGKLAVRGVQRATDQ